MRQRQEGCRASVTSHNTAWPLSPSLFFVGFSSLVDSPNPSEQGWGHCAAGCLSSPFGKTPWEHLEGLQVSIPDFPRVPPLPFPQVSGVLARSLQLPP